MRKLFIKRKILPIHSEVCCQKVILGEFSFAILLQKLVMTYSNFKNLHDFNNEKKKKKNPHDPTTNPE